MDFLHILRSIEELLYEVMAWLVFYPRTLWRSIRHPLQMMRYSDAEQQTDAPAKQYSDTLSPPLFLLLSILVAHAIEVAMHEKIVLHGGLAGELVKSHEYLLMLRAIAFSIVPLMFAVALLNGLGQPIDREKLRRPFYSQCYVAAPFALAFGLSSVAMRSHMHPLQIAGGITGTAAIVWYLWLQTTWLSTHLKISIVRGLLLALWTSLKAVAIIVAIALVLIF